MKKAIKTVLFIGALLLLIGGFGIYRFLGNKYWKPTLFFHSKYVDEPSTDSEFPNVADANISLLKETYHQTFYIIKAYRYSKDVWSIGYGGGGSRTDDYFHYGLADSGKHELIPAQYQSLHVFEARKTGKLFVLCEQLNGPKTYYDIEEEEGKIRLIKRGGLGTID
ncbi:hypothetical protein LCL86_00155 [Muricauda ruestringensis]|jgi:hypothetical protein|uniref:hypothetical protein n=1 Tax=Flagellimonas ruestringensis TaxID=111501 RepID=UPI001CD64F01|nr:hypothetical protein [Allomuricauda ruestringensis]MCA0957435.1 hypothetical protein [Allomuricauda ruestringensis]